MNGTLRSSCSRITRTSVPYCDRSCGVCTMLLKRTSGVTRAGHEEHQPLRMFAQRPERHRRSRGKLRRAVRSPRKADAIPRAAIRCRRTIGCRSTRAFPTTIRMRPRRSTPPARACAHRGPDRARPSDRRSAPRRPTRIRCRPRARECRRCPRDADRARSLSHPNLDDSTRTPSTVTSALGLQIRSWSATTGSEHAFSCPCGSVGARR